MRRRLSTRLGCSNLPTTVTLATGTVLPPGRNQPCPCGSGKKYKNCCLPADELRGRGVSAALGRDRALAQAMLEWAGRRLGPTWQLEVLGLRDQEGSYVSDFVTSCALHVLPFRGKPASAWYQEAHAHLTPVDREFLASVRAAWTSVWQVREPGPSRALLLDRLTGEERLATLHPEHGQLREGEMLLARVGSLAGEAFLHVAEPGALPASEADAVLSRVRHRLGGDLPIGPERLSLAGTTAALLALWREAYFDWSDRFDAEAERLEARPYLTDRFSFAPGERSGLEQRALALPGAEEEFRDELALDLVVRDLAKPGVGDGELLSIREEELVLETRSTAQADELRKLVEAQLGASIRFLERSIVESPTEGYDPDEGDDDLDGEGESLHDEAGLPHSRFNEAWPATTEPTESDRLAAEVLRLIDAKQLDEAESTARQLEARFPEDTTGIERLGQVFEARGMATEATERYRRAVALMDNPGDGHYCACCRARMVKAVRRLDPTGPALVLGLDPQ